MALNQSIARYQNLLGGRELQLGSGRNGKSVELDREVSRAEPFEGTSQATSPLSSSLGLGTGRQAPPAHLVHVYMQPEPVELSGLVEEKEEGSKTGQTTRKLNSALEEDCSPRGP